MRLLHKSLLATALIALAAVMCVSAQDTRPKFEVASIKRNTSGDRRTRVGADGTRNNFDRFVATNASLRMLTRYAYDQLRSDEIVEGPPWIDSDRFDVEARPEHSNEPIPLDRIRLMLQSLLMERFQLKTHIETRNMAVYNLAVVKVPPKIKLSEDQTPPPPPGVPSQDGQLKRGEAQVEEEQRGFVVSGRTVPLSSLIQMLQGPALIDRRILDKTGLMGLFDFQLQFNPEIRTGPQVTPQVDIAFPSIFTALQEQLGLKLESARGPVEVLVIDSVSKPSEN